MDCREARDLLQDELDGRLSPADAARLDEHVRVCAACADERQGFASLRATFRAVPKAAAPTGFRTDVMARLPKGRVVALRRALGVLVAAAAVVVVAVTLLPRTRVGERDMAAAPPRFESAGPPAAAAASPKPAAIRERGESRDGRLDAPSADAKQEAAGEESLRRLDETRRRAPGEKAAGEAPPPAAPPAKDAGATADNEKPSVSAGEDAEASKQEKLAKKELEDTPTKTETAADEAKAKAKASARSREVATTVAGAAEPAVRYVVFRDAAAADRFAARIAAVGGRGKSAETRGGGGGGGGAPAPGAEADKRPEGFALRDDAATLDALELETERVLRDSDEAERRVVARPPLAVALGEARLSDEVRRSGGSLVPPEKSDGFAALLATGTRIAREAKQDGGKARQIGDAGPETPAPARAPAAPKPVPGQPLPPPALTPPAGGTFGAAGLTTGAPSESVPGVVLVIVVVEPAPPAAGGKK